MVAAQGEPVTAGAGCPGDGGEAGEAAQQPREGDGGFEAGQGVAKAAMGSGAEAEWLAASAGGIEGAGVGVARGVAVGGADKHDQLGAGRDWNAVDDLPGRQGLAGSELDGDS